MIEYRSYNLRSGETQGALSSISTASVCLGIDGQERIGVVCGDNSLAALLEAFCRATGIAVKMKAYQTRERYRSGNPLGKASVRIVINGKERKGYGRNTDSRKAFLLALIEATNQIQEEVKNGVS